MYIVHVSVFAKTIFRYVNKKFYTTKIINMCRGPILKMSSRTIKCANFHVTIKFV